MLDKLNLFYKKISKRNLAVLSNLRAQGSLEYLLLIGGAVLVATIVIGLLTSIGMSAIERVPSGEDIYDKLRIKLRLVAGGEQLLAYWKFDEDSLTQLDYSGNGNTAQANEVTYVAGKCNGALEFDSTGDYIKAEPSQTLNITEPFTISAWIKASSTEGLPLGHPMVNKYKFAEGSGLCSNHYDEWTGYYLGLDSRKPTIHIHGQQQGSIEYLCHQVVADNTWHNIVGGWDGDKMFIYIDGEYMNSSNCKSRKFYPDCTSEVIEGETSDIWAVNPASNNAWVIFGGARDTDVYFAGLMDEVKIFNKALSAAEIVQIIECP